MNVLIHTVGTRGDVQPYVALGRGLLAVGHEVTICTCDEFESFVTEHGLQYTPMNSDILQFMRSEDGRLAMEGAGSFLQMVRLGFRLWPKMGAMLQRQISDAWASTVEVSPDVILFHPKAAGAKDFAEKLEIPCGLAFYLPMFVPTGDYPAAGFPRLNIGRWYNRLTYRLVDLATRMSVGEQTKVWRKKNGLPRPRGRFLQYDSRQDIPVLHGFSRSVVPQPGDWPAHAVATGYWFLEHDHHSWQPPDSLTQFLASGEPPVYIGFGSIFGRDPARVTRLIVDAVHQAGCRAILATGWGGLDVDQLDLPPSILAIESAPHDWLFPRVAAVVHHGGCGTTAAGLRAGKPTVICPFFGDQPFWGSVVERLGVGCTPIPQRKLSVDNLATALKSVTSDTAMMQRADELGQQIRSEDGVATAVQFIEQQFTPSSTSEPQV